jgi:hypothetical protein
MDLSILIDIETLSRRPDAIITEIAAVAFDPNTPDFIERNHIIMRPCIASQLADFRDFEPETIQFHFKNGSLPERFSGQSPLDACRTLTGFISHIQPRRVWIWGKDFDRPILESFFRYVDLPFPWEYWQTSCGRDAWHLAFGGSEKPAKRPHSALADARASVADLNKALHCLNRLSVA